MATAVRAKARPAIRTVVWVLDNEVLPQLKELKAGQERLERQAKESGLNGHNALLKAFLDDQVARKKSREARDKVVADLAAGLKFLQAPRNLASGLIKTFVVAAISAYVWALLYGKITFPLTFH